MSLYTDLVAMGATLDHHESDLYVKCTPEAMRLVVEDGRMFEVFRSAVDQSEWVDVPFAYEPFWDGHMANIQGTGTRGR